MAKQLTTSEKDNIKELAIAYIGRYPSQNKAAESLKGVSAATLTAIRQSKYDSISDDMWKKIYSQVGVVNRADWRVCTTSAFEDIEFVLNDARTERNVYWLIGGAGCGKSTTAKVYESSNREVFTVLCSEDMKKRDFIKELATKVGIAVDGNSVREMLDIIIKELIKMDNPLLIFDEADKLNDNILYYIISLYNRLEDKTGIVLMSTSYAEKRMRRGLELKKRGYEELWSRIGRKFWGTERTTGRDVYTICQANGLNDEARISEVIKEAEGCGWDLRRVKKAVHRAKRLIGA